MRHFVRNDIRGVIDCVRDDLPGVRHFVRDDIRGVIDCVRDD